MTSASRPRTRHIVVRDARIAVDTWPNAGRHRADLVLVHGGAAHRGWWHPTAEALSSSFNVVTMDLSGHGDSSWRESYDLHDWAAEVIEVASTFCEEAPVAVGHSMGGLVVANAAATAPAALQGIVAFDTQVRPRKSEVLARRRRNAARAPRWWPDQESAADSFSPVPPAAEHASALVREVALRSFRRTEQGWTSKLDPRVFLRPDSTPSLLSDIQIPAVWIRSGNGIIGEQHAQELRAHLTGRGVLIDLPGAGHHLLLDEPLASAWLVATVVMSLRSS